jgi:hypothetical protein
MFFPASMIALMVPFRNFSFLDISGADMAQ